MHNAFLQSFSVKSQIILKAQLIPPFVKWLSFYFTSKVSILFPYLY